MARFVFLAVLVLAAVFLIRRILLARRDAPQVLPPPRKVITEQEYRALFEAAQAMALPLVRMTADPAFPVSPQASRIGGDPFAPEVDAPWPVGASGRDMVFLVQINMTDLATLPDMPRQGILQVFADPDANERGLLPGQAAGASAVRWFPAPHGSLVQPARRRPGPLVSPEARGAGVALIAIPDRLPPTVEMPPMLHRRPETFGRKPENDGVAEIINNWDKLAEKQRASYGVHWCGGHPLFHGDEPRQGTNENFSCLLLHLGQDEHFNPQWAKYLNLMIQPQDLAAGKLDRARLFWGYNEF